jgi:hypothetical protein
MISLCISANRWNEYQANTISEKKENTMFNTTSKLNISGKNKNIKLNTFCMQFKTNKKTVLKKKLSNKIEQKTKIPAIKTKTHFAQKCAALLRRCTNVSLKVFVPIAVLDQVTIETIITTISIRIVNSDMSFEACKL